jgi:pseudouridine-5'-phosphate glycosidase
MISMKNLSKYLDLTPEVADALVDSKPVVALESTIISHGMPWPDNLTVAEECERLVREEGAVPATIAVLDGRLKAGLTRDELEIMAQSKNIQKLSRRDIPVAVALKQNGATTVASTMIIAALAGIRVFATGGIGGVHRGAEQSFDISADLQELAQTAVAVVSAGCKSILDIGLTLEYLETQGVPVIGYRSDNFAAFYSSDSGFKADCRINTPEEIAMILHAKWSLGLRGGVVISNPVPEEYEMPGEQINQVIAKALIEAEQKGIKGKEVTPFLLSCVKELTAGKSLETNKQLVFNNARLAAKVASELNSISS